MTYVCCTLCQSSDKATCMFTIHFVQVKNCLSWYVWNTLCSGLNFKLIYLYYGHTCIYIHILGINSYPDENEIPVIFYHYQPERSV